VLLTSEYFVEARSGTDGDSSDNSTSSWRLSYPNR
jgi:hypothetical protein